MKPHEGQPLLAAGAPLSDAHAAMIMVHGRGASAESILELASLLPHDEFAFLAPAAANNTWYPYSFLSETSRNEPALSSALEVLDHLVADIETRGIPRDHIVLLGFSQGACLSGEFGVRHPGRYGGLALLSGGLIGPPGTVWGNAGSFDGTPVFLGCSDIDPHIPKERVEESAAVFRRMSADVTERLYRGMGHTINSDEVAVVRSLMEQVARSR